MSFSELYGVILLVLYLTSLKISLVGLSENDVGPVVLYIFPVPLITIFLPGSFPCNSLSLFLNCSTSWKVCEFNGSVNLLRALCVVSAVLALSLFTSSTPWPYKPVTPPVLL